MSSKVHSAIVRQSTLKQTKSPEPVKEIQEVVKESDAFVVSLFENPRRLPIFRCLMVFWLFLTRVRIRRIRELGLKGRWEEALKLLAELSS